VSGSSPPRPSAVQAEADGTGELLVTRTQLEAFPWPGFNRYSGNPWNLPFQNQPQKNTRKTHENTYPLVNVSVYVTMENHHAINGKFHVIYVRPFSIAMLVYQRV